VEHGVSDEFQAAFRAAKRAMAEAAEAAFQAHGVRSGQQWILRCLWAEDGLSPGEIARRLDLATPTVTKAATRMEAAGLLTRQAHPGDARLVRLQLTDRGRALEKTISEEMHQLTRRALGDLGDAEISTLTRCLVRIRENLHAT
jgi:DNA-binding MarR family transcriptional regulator